MHHQICIVLDSPDVVVCEETVDIVRADPGSYSEGGGGGRVGLKEGGCGGRLRYRHRSLLIVIICSPVRVISIKVGSKTPMGPGY